MSDPLNDSPASDSPKLAPIPPGPVKLPPLKLPPKPVLSGPPSTGGLKPPMPLVPPSSSVTSVPPVVDAPKPQISPAAPSLIQAKETIPLSKPPVAPVASTAPSPDKGIPSPMQAPKVAIKLQTTSSEGDASRRSLATSVNASEEEPKNENDLIPAIAATVLALLALAVQLWTLFS